MEMYQAQMNVFAKCFTFSAKILSKLKNPTKLYFDISGNPFVNF